MLRWLLLSDPVTLENKVDRVCFLWKPRGGCASVTTLVDVKFVKYSFNHGTLKVTWILSSPFWHWLWTVPCHFHVDTIKDVELLCVIGWLHWCGGQPGLPDVVAMYCHKVVSVTKSSIHIMMIINIIIIAIPISISNFPWLDALLAPCVVPVRYLTRYFSDRIFP